MQPPSLCLFAFDSFFCFHYHHQSALLFPIQWQTICVSCRGNAKLICRYFRFNWPFFLFHVSKWGISSRYVFLFSTWNIDRKILFFAFSLFRAIFCFFFTAKRLLTMCTCILVNVALQSYRFVRFRSIVLVSVSLLTILIGIALGIRNQKQNENDNEANEGTTISMKRRRTEILNLSLSVRYKQTSISSSNEWTFYRRQWTIRFTKIFCSPGTEKPRWENAREEIDNIALKPYENSL